MNWSRSLRNLPSIIICTGTALAWDVRQRQTRELAMAGTKPEPYTTNKYEIQVTSHGEHSLENI
jgi:hypothetical protein